MRRHERPERDDPGAHPEKLEAVRAVTENVAERGAVAQHRTKVEHVAVRSRRLERRHRETHADHDEWPEAGDEKRGAPADSVGDKLRYQEREPDADRET